MYKQRAREILIEQLGLLHEQSEEYRGALIFYKSISDIVESLLKTNLSETERNQTGEILMKELELYHEYFKENLERQLEGYRKDSEKDISFDGLKNLLHGVIQIQNLLYAVLTEADNT